MVKDLASTNSHLSDAGGVDPKLQPTTMQSQTSIATGAAIDTVTGLAIPGPPPAPGGSMQASTAAAAAASANVQQRQQQPIYQAPAFPMTKKQQLLGGALRAAKQVSEAAQTVVLVVQKQ